MVRGRGAGVTGVTVFKWRKGKRRSRMDERRGARSVKERRAGCSWLVVCVCECVLLGSVGLQACVSLL